MGDTLEIFGKEYTNVAGFKAKDGSGNTLTYTRGSGGGITPTGTINITTNGTHDVTNYASADVNVPIVEIYTATITTAGTSADSYVLYNGTKYYSLNSTFTFSAGDTCTIHGEGARANGRVYENNVLIADGVLNYVYTLPEGSICIDLDSDSMSGSYADVYIFTPTIPRGTLEVTTNGSVVVRDYNKIDVNVPSSTPSLQSKTAMPTESAQTITADSGYGGLSSVAVGAISSTYVGSGIARKSSSDLTASGATITAPAGYYAESASKSVATTTHANPTASINSSTGLVTASHTQTAGYVSAGTTTGTLQLTTQAAKTVTPTESSQTAVAAGVYTTGAVTVGAISSTYVGSGITQRSSSALTASGATVTVPAGYYASQATKSVASGSAGTPTATKGTVSNHSITVTPSVTNTTGYITGGTKSGTGVTVSASELVSGSQTITANGTVDVTNLASVDVALTFSTIYTGINAPSSSIGSNGDIYIQTS